MVQRGTEDDGDRATPAVPIVIGVSARTAPAEVRERLLLSRRDVMAVLEQAAERVPGAEVLVLANCTRTELWVAGAERAAVRRLWVDLVETGRGPAPGRGGGRYELDGDNAVRHLLRVACGLDSAILGDIEILGQVRGAAELARKAGTMGESLSQAASLALRAGRRAQRDTDIGWGSAGIGSAVATLVAERRALHAADLDVLVVGAGKAGRAVARAIEERGLGTLTIVNRSPAAASRLAREVGGTSRPWLELADAVVAADVVVATTAAPEPILPISLLAEARDRRTSRPLTVVDVGAPHNAETVDGVERVPLEDIQDRRAGAASRRRAAVPAAEEVVATELEAWRRWRWRRPIEALLHRLQADAAAISREAAHALTASPHDAPATRAETEEIILRSFERLLHDHAGRLRDLTAGTVRR